MPTATSTDSRFRLDEARAKQLAETYGTPLYVIDEAHFRGRIRRYRNAALAAYARSEITFASKANSTLALIAIAAAEGCDIDVASEGELRAALAAGVPASRCHLHGNNKSLADLEFAINAGIGFIVADHFSELETLASLLKCSKAKVVIRLAPGVDPHTHSKISTGQADTKFGFNIADGSGALATEKALALGLPLYGFHCHVGSQLLDPEAQRSGGELISSFAAEMANRFGYNAEYINIGGGLGVHYTDKDEPMAVEEYCRLITESTLAPLRKIGIEPVLGQEPGRSLVAESGVTLYRVGVIKTVPVSEGRRRTYVAVDGGLSDNPRPALYGSRYMAERVVANGGRAAEDAVLSPNGDSMLATISGKHCETDRLFEDVELPRDLAEGDLLQVLVTGAYNSSMASNYNRYPRPATALLLEKGGEALIQRRDSWDEMLAREIIPPGLTG